MSTHTSQGPSTASRDLGVAQKLANVFVGNIPLHAIEEELVSELSVFGPVVSFKLIVDKTTGKPKGYGFCQFRDHETALSAVRNQKGLLFQGRQLRVGMAHSAEERRNLAAVKNQKVTVKELETEERVPARELDVFALRQALKLRAQAATKVNPKKRENPNCMPDATKPSKKLMPLTSPPSKYHAPSTSTGNSLESAITIETKGLQETRTKETPQDQASHNGSPRGADQASHQASPTASFTSNICITTELTDISRSVASSATLGLGMQQGMHADLARLLRLLSGSENGRTSISTASSPQVIFAV